MSTETPTMLTNTIDPADAVFRWTCPPGLEDVSADEARALLAETMPDGPCPPIEAKPLGLEGHNALSSSLPADRVAGRLMKLRSAYHLIRHRGYLTVPSSASTASHLAAALGELDIPELADGTRSFRVSCTRSGEHAFRSPDVEREVGAVIVERYGSPVDLERYDINLRVDVIADVVLIGIQLSTASLDRRYAWVYRPRVTLRTTLAYGMVTLARRALGEAASRAALPRGEVASGAGDDHSAVARVRALLDPFCGSGTIAIEASFLLPDARIVAADRDEEAVDGARRNLDAVGTTGRIDVRTADARDLDEHYAPGSIDAIVTNPPFGIRMHKEADFRRLYRRFLETAHLILAPHGVIVILVGKKRGIFNTLLRELGLYDLLEVRIIEIGGVYPGIFVLRQRGAA